MASAPIAAQEKGYSRSRELLDAQVSLLYSNAGVAAGVTILSATILAYLVWPAIAHSRVVGWWLYMFAIVTGRFALASRHSTAASSRTQLWWARAYACGAGLSGAGWGAAGILLYDPARLTNQLFLAFVLGGMMIGAVPLLAPRPDAFLAFLVPAGLTPAIRLLIDGGDPERAMGLLAAVFTAAMVVTTSAVHRTIDSMLRVKFENRDLVESLRAAIEHAEDLNRELELRVSERTAELEASNEKLRAEMEQRQQAEDELLKARKLESLGVLAGGIAHDFNNFLTVVQGNVALAKMEPAISARVGENLQQIEEACRRAAFLASQLLTFAKGGAPVRRPVSTAALVRDAVHLARAGSAVSIDLQTAPDVLPVEADAGQMGQVLHNLLLNARQAMPEGGIIEVRAENAPDDGSGSRHAVRISIRDYGCGIPESVLPRIFDPYFTTKPGKSGLGLATAYAIVGKHGGRITVESRTGEGTTATVELPASREPVEEAVRESAPRVAAKRTGRILVMDDETALLTLIDAVLARAGYEVRTAADGAEAIARYETAQKEGRAFDAVLLDLTVSGGMGGMEAAARIRELDPWARLIVSSGYSDAAVMADFRKYGFDDVIPKPWAIEGLTAVFERVMTGNLDQKTE